MMSSSKRLSITKMSILKLVTFMLSGLLVASYDSLPERVVKLYPRDDATLSIYSDELIGGNSRASWINQSQSQFKCDMSTSQPVSYCGSSITWFGNEVKILDFSAYQHLVVDITYQGSTANLAVYMYNQTQKIKGIIDTDDPKNIATTIRSEEFNGPVKIRFSDFRVADWWIAQHNIPREYAHVELDKITSLGIAPFSPFSATSDSFQVNAIYIQGTYFSKEQLYGALLIFWACLLIGEALMHYIALQKRILRDAKKLQSLTEISEQYKVKSETDKLTGLSNREGLSQALKNIELNHSKKEFALLIIDIDFFKKLNDRYGHDIGDIVLEDLSQVIHQNCRSSDLVCRWGGEEFVILFRIEKPQDATLFAEKIRLQIASTAFAGSLRLPLTISIGIALMHEQENFEITFKRADQALYAAKRNGRNQIKMAD
jgi:diguanylate cyclase (GGDEF)-like protein